MKNNEIYVNNSISNKLYYIENYPVNCILTLKVLFTNENFETNEFIGDMNVILKTDRYPYTVVEIISIVLLVFSIDILICPIYFLFIILWPIKKLYSYIVINFFIIVGVFIIFTLISNLVAGITNLIVFTLISIILIFGKDWD